MRFARRTKAARRREWLEYRMAWHRWFARLPTRINDTQVVWLETIERRRRYRRDGWDWQGFWLYREAPRAA